MIQSSLSSVAIFHCHKEGTDDFDLVAVAKEFVSKHDTKIIDICKIFHWAIDESINTWV